MCRIVRRRWEDGGRGLKCFWLWGNRLRELLAGIVFCEVPIYFMYK
jgi:hypothetical protein